MKGLMIISTLVACSLARPDIGLNIRNGYQYQPPSTNYGTPSIPTGSYLPSGNQGSASNQFVSGTHVNIGDLARQGSGFHQEHSSTNYQQPGSGFQQGGNTGFQTSNQFQSINEFQTGGIQSPGGFQQHQTGGSQSTGGFQQQQTQVHKHVYFYDSPEDLPAPTIRLTGGASAAQKNYKIIFIKAPAYQAPQVPQIPIQQQNEEKTLVYVLVKKPDDAQDIVVPTLTPSKPSKPEVFFIKYKTQKEAEAHVQNIQNGGQGSGDAANQVDSSSTFVQTITDTKTIGGAQIGGSVTTSNAGDFPNIFAGGDHANHGTETKTSTIISGSGPSQLYGPSSGSGPY